MRGIPSSLGEMRTAARTNPIYAEALRKLDAPKPPQPRFKTPGAESLPFSVQSGVRFTIRGTPMGKPRMTQQDKWMKREPVVRYHAWCNEARLHLPPLPPNPSRVDLTAYLPIPDSWSGKKKVLMAGKPHRVRPDIDNIFKGALDMLFENDAGICDGTLSKRWDDGDGPRLEVFVQ